MDRHCPWINNCVGHKNYKFYILFLFYACLTSLCVAYLMGAGATIMFSRRNAFKKAFNHAWFWYTMTLCGSVLLGALYFSFHLINLLVEQFESLEDNQSYIDEKKADYGI